MDLSDVAPWILPALWLLFSLFRRVAEGGGDLPSQPRPGPPVPVAEVAAERVGSVQRALSDASAACDPRMASLLAPFFQSANEELEAVRQSLSEGPPAPDTLQRLGGLETACRHVNGLARQRSTADLITLHETGDRLSEGLFQPVRVDAERKGLTLDMRPPLVVAGAPTRTQLAGTVALPTTVRNRPWEWSILAESLGQRVADATAEEAFGALQLDVGDEPLTADSPALARVLFGSWLHVMISDASALLLLGPAYLQALTARLRAPGRARSVTQVQVSDQGLAPTPASHARVHLAVEWLSLQGEEQASRQIRDAWDEEHGHPEALSLFTSGGEMLLPLRAVFGHFHDILEDLDGLRLDTLGRSRLAEFPGLSGWPREARTARAARDRLVRGESAAASPRALLAATIEAALQSPVSGPSISTALLASLRGEGVAAVSRKPRVAVSRERGIAAVSREAAVAVVPRKRAGVSPRPAGRLRAGDGTRVAEALLIGELILDRPSRR